MFDLSALLPAGAAGLSYFALGGLWFSPLFGKLWARDIGFERPRNWQPALYAAVTGSYHALGALLCSAVRFWFRR